MKKIDSTQKLGIELTPEEAKYYQDKGVLESHGFINKVNKATAMYGLGVSEENYDRLKKEHKKRRRKNEYY